MCRLESVRITKLFGYKGNDYNVNFIKDGPITFVYAFNGVGKTTLLKLLYAVINQNFALLFSIEFETIILNFTQNEQLIVKKDKKGNNHASFTYALKHPGKIKVLGHQSFISVVSFSKEDENTWTIEIEKYCLEIDQFLHNINTDILFANKDYGRVVLANNDPYLETDNIPINLQVLEKLISEYKEKKSEYKVKIQKKTNKISNLAVLGGILGAVAGPLVLAAVPAGAISVVGGAFGTSIGLFNLNKKRKDSSIIKNEGMEKEFLDIPLPDKINYIQNSLNNDISKDESIEKKIALFEDIINTYNPLTDKTLHINRKTGKLEIKTIFSDSEQLEATYLSSGEKNMLLLYFYIIFTIKDSITDDETFIALIDEPEVSMHSAWLMHFVDSLKHIDEVLDRKDNYQYIITTHSPGITFGNSDLMVELKRD